MHILEIIAPMAAFAVLFILFAVTRPPRRCSGGCAGCTRSCGTGEGAQHD